MQRFPIQIDEKMKGQVADLLNAYYDFYISDIDSLVADLEEIINGKIPDTLKI